MMQLYSGTTCPFSHRCRFVLYEKGMDFQVIDVDLYNKPEDIAVMNPYNRLPVLVERDLILYESNIINEYIDDRFPHPQLMPADPEGEIRCLEAMEYICGTVHPQAFTRQFRPANFTPTEADVPKVVEQGKALAARYFDVIDRTWRGGEWMLPHGYSVAAPDALVLWEAQFGDFVNGAQIVVDQFLVAGLSKWGQTSRLTLLLPHGYEGNGPEHSSAKVERFLQLAAQENIRVANCTTAAQYFHLLRRQALDATARPLVVMTPKGLLRLKQAGSTLAELAEGRFEPVLDDPGADHSAVTRLVLTSGKLYYDIEGHERRAEAASVAVARLEQLYPFPVDAAAALTASYPNLRELVWAQEEPQNMGAWRTIRHRLEAAAPDEVPVRYVGRPWRASPSEGYPTAHRLEQDRIVREALGGA